MYTAGENMTCETLLERSFTLSIKNKDSHIFHSDKNENGKQDCEIQCISLGKWVKNCDTPSCSVIEKNELNPHQLDLVRYAASVRSRVRKTKKCMLQDFIFVNQ